MPKIITKPKLERVGKSLVVASVKSIEEAKKIIHEMAFQTERFGKQLTPVDTGRLRASIRVGFPVNVKDIRAEIFTLVHYAPFVHFGTRYMRARPFLVEGKELMLRQFTGEKIANRLDEQYRKEFIKL